MRNVLFPFRGDLLRIKGIDLPPHLIKVRREGKCAIFFEKFAVMLIEL